MTAQLVSRAVVVIALLMLTASNWPKEAHAQSADELTSLRTQVSQLYSQGKYAESASIVERYVALARQKYGDNHAEYATAISWLALVYKAQGRYAEAEPLFKRSLAIREMMLGPMHTDVASSLNNLAVLYEALGRYSEAEPLFKRALAIDEKALGPEHLHVASTLNNLAGLYEAQGRTTEAEPLFKRALAIDEKGLGPEHTDVAVALNNLAGLYETQGRYGEADALYKRSLAIREKALGPEHPAVATALYNLAWLYRAQGRNDEAEPLLKRALAIDEKTLGPEHPNVGSSFYNLAELYRAQGRYGEADALYKRSLAIREKAFGPEHPAVASSLNGLVELYRAQGRNDEAVPLLKRALAIDEKALGPEHPEVATALNNLAGFYHAQGHYAEAEPLYKSALGTWEKALGPEHPEVATALNNLAGVYLAQGRYAEAEPLLKRALGIREKALGPEHPDVALSLNNLAGLYRTQGRNGEAEPLLRRALGILEKALGPEHPDVALSLNNLAGLALAQHDWMQAASYWRTATKVIERRAELSLAGFQGASVKGEAVRNRWYFEGLIKATYRLAPEGHAERVKQALEMFETAQWAQASDAASSLEQMAARNAKGDAVLARLVRERQDQFAEWQVKDKQLIAAKSEPPFKRDPGAEKSLNDRLTAIEARLASIDAQFAKDFPDYAALTNPKSVSIAEVQSQLNEREALVLLFDTVEFKPSIPEETFIWVVTKDDMRWVRSELGTEALSDDVAKLRCGLDAALWDDEKSSQRCSDLLKTVPAKDAYGNIRAETLPFDLARSHRLYRALFGQVEDLIRGRDLLIVSSGPLTQLPFQVLIVSSPNADAFGLKTRAVGRLGAELRELPDAVRRRLKQQGVAIPRLVTGGPAEAAGVNAGDILLAIDGMAVDSVQQAIGAIRARVPGTAVQLQLWRNGVEIKIVASLDAATIQDWVPHFLDVLSERDVDWLARSHSLTVLPAVSSLKALRQFAKESHADRKLIGFGNPLLDGPDARYAKLAAAARSKTSCPRLPMQRIVEQTGKRHGVPPLSLRSRLADVAEIRNQVPLPETADELCAVARDLRVSEKDIWLGNRATEAEVKRLSAAGELAKYRIIHFATHGALAGQISGNSEPGLILTPPTTATEQDDGYLSASEIAGLRLEADWVILSACNTAAGGAEGAEALSGLARAFFYAGARALLVSHWAVASDATVKLITGAVERIASDKRIGRVDAMRQSMLALIDKGEVYETHPAFWAPFVVVGEGAAR